MLEMCVEARGHRKAAGMSFALVTCHSRTLMFTIMNHVSDSGICHVEPRMFSPGSSG